MKKYESLVMNTETGEVVTSTNLTEKERVKITKIEVDKMLCNANVIDELDLELLFRWCKITGLLNNYNQVKVDGRHKDKKFEVGLINGEARLLKNVFKVINSAHPFSNMLMKNRQTYVSTWTELYKSIGIDNHKNAQTELKKFLTKNNVVREFKIGGQNGDLVKRLVLNPFLAREGSYTSQIAVSVFQEFIRDGENISTYLVRFMQSLGIVS